MAGLFNVIKLLFFPAVIAAAIYTLLAYVLIPLYRNQLRYNQYLPLSTITSHTTSMRQRITRALGSILMPTSSSDRGTRGFFGQNLFGRRHGDSDIEGRPSMNSEDDLLFGEDEGESMVGFDVERRDRTVRGGHVNMNRQVDSGRRLSRDLEEGFQDESEDEVENRAGDDRRR